MEFIDNLPLLFHENFNSWVRLEPRCRQTDFAEGLTAKIADPLWMLFRQKQMGEFQAEDAGSAIKVNVEYRTVPIQAATWGENEECSLVGSTEDSLPQPSPPPLEALIERDSFPMTWKMRVQIGQQFERFVMSAELEATQAKDLIKKCREDFPVPSVEDENNMDLDVETKNFLRIMKGRAIDGEKLLDAVENDPYFSAEQHQDIKDKLLKWYQDLYFQRESDDQSAWNERQMEYRFGLKCAGDFELKAPSYRNGELDWYTCDAVGESFSPIEEPSPPSRARPFSRRLPNIRLPRRRPKRPPFSRISPMRDRDGISIIREDFTPTRVSFGGMPNHRWWAFEDNQINFGNLDVNTTDLATTMLMEFALVYGNDWLMVPLELDLGSLTNISEVTVYDTFGGKTKIDPAQSSTSTNENAYNRWEIFSLSSMPGSVLFIPPVTNHREESSPIEEVRFIRDEGANMVWAIEHTVLNGVGNSVSAFDLYGKDNLRPVVSNDNSEGLPSYRLASHVSLNWIPYVPVNSSQGSDEVVVELRQAQMPSTTNENISPKSLCLKDGDLERIDEEAISRSGIKLQFTKQRVRWTDGKTYVWFGRKVVTGRGEGNSGLRFDYLEGGG